MNFTTTATLSEIIPRRLAGKRRRTRRKTNTLTFGNIPIKKPKLKIKYK